MAYDLVKTDGSHLTTLGDGYIDTSTGINLIGRNTPSYGDAQNENFIRLLENFSGKLDPSQRGAINALTGTLWYDTNTNTLRAYDGINWNTTSGPIVANTAPLLTGGTESLKFGALWYDVPNQQLNTWTGVEWKLVGPQAKASQGKSGNYVETILDPAGVYHIVVNQYINNNLVSITSFDGEFTPLTAIAGFTTIRPGVNLTTLNVSTVLNGTATNSIKFNNLFANAFARVDQPTTFTSDVSVNGNLILSSANIYYNSASKSLTAYNYALNGNVDIYVNKAAVKTSVLHINGATGLAEINGDPVTDNGIATKHYVDQINDELFANLDVTTGRLQYALDNFNTDYLSNINAVISSTNANLNAVQAGINSNVTTLTTLTNNRLNYANVYLNFLQQEVEVVAYSDSLKAPIESPTFTGNAIAPNVAAMNNYITSLAGSQYQISLVSPVASVANGAFLTQQIVSTPWSSNTVYNLGSIVYHGGNSYVVNGNVFANTWANVVTGAAQYVYSGSILTTGNYRVIANVNGSTTVPVTVITNNLNFTYPSVVEINGVVINNQITGISLISPGLSYPGIGDNSGRIATTAYVDATANLVYGDYDHRIRQEITNRINYVDTSVAPKANIASPTLTGTPAAPTATPLTWSTAGHNPLSGDTTTTIATTAYVATSISNQKFNYTVSTQPPSGGSDGDFWFQVD
jgi:hypothetical protein